MNTKLIINKHQDQQIKAITQSLTKNGLKKDHPDVLWMEDEKLGVEQVKKIREFLSLKPYSAQGRGVVVLNAHNLTPDAQNALLKTLEEPPVNSIILLAADSEKAFLETVLSRCEVIRLEMNLDLQNQSLDEINSAERQRLMTEDIKKLLRSTLEQRFAYIETLEEKEEFLDALIKYFRTELITHHSLAISQFTKELIKAEEWREANGNMRAILEYLMLKLPIKQVP